MRGYLQGLVDSGKSIDSARAIYDNWVRCCEEVYGEEVITPEYARIHGHLINAQMALKKRMSVMVDESLGALNMPSRSELRPLQDRLQETRRENKRLRQDLLSLQRQVATLVAAGSSAQSAPAPDSRARAQPRATPVPRPSIARPTTAKKTAARKKAAAKPAKD
jgi:beta-phosphoglucomutase-like phosphatase (HAD superfamily)